MGKFLKNATSVLKIDGSRTRFLWKLPMLPNVVGFAKHVVSIANGVPVPSAVPGLRLGSHTTFDRAFKSPPVKFVTVVEVQTVVEPVCFTKPGAQLSAAATE